VKNDQVDAALTLAFQRVFGSSDKARSPEQLLVLARFRQLARPHRPSFSPVESERTHAMREGRREMWLEIENRCAASKPPTIAEILGIPAEKIEET
jgi:hypothetical protein